MLDNENVNHAYGISKSGCEFNPPTLKCGAAMFFMPNGIFKMVYRFQPHIEMWGYHVLSCLTAFDVVPGSTAVAFILTQKYCDVMGLCWVIHQKKVPLGTPDTVAPVFPIGVPLAQTG